MSRGALEGKRVLVVGASSGIGNAIGRLVAEAGGRVAFAARRVDQCQETAGAAGNGAIGLRCDVRDPAACDAVVRDTVAAFGGLDAIVYATGVSPIGKLASADVDVWRLVLETNVMGANLVCRAALPHLRESKGRAVFLSSTSVGRPYPALVPYASSKAALEESIRGWRAENPDLCFSCVVVGPTLGTDFGTIWDMEVAAEIFPFWQAHGYEAGDLNMTTEEMASVVADVLASPTCVHHAVAFADPAVGPRNLFG